MAARPRGKSAWLVRGRPCLHLFLVCMRIVGSAVCRALQQPRMPRSRTFVTGGRLDVEDSRDDACGPGGGIPSTVTTWHPSTEYSGARQALTERCTSLPFSKLDTMTVHAPQPPSPHPSLVPVRPTPATQHNGASAFSRAENTQWPRSQWTEAIPHSRSNPVPQIRVWFARISMEEVAIAVGGEVVTICIH